MRAHFRSAFCLLAALIATVGRPVDAQMVRYRADGSSLFWFVQISDTHVSTFFNDWYDDQLTAVLADRVPVIGPRFVVITGDITDGTNGFIYGTGPHQQEWDEYRSLVDTAGMTPDFLFDISGNHDAYGDGELSFWLRNSLAGQAYGTTQPWWRLGFAHGSYAFFGISDQANDGRQWWSDNSILTGTELAEVERHLIDAGDVRLAMLFGHHPLSIVENHERLFELAATYNATHYACGHEHDRLVRADGSLVQFRINSLGQASDDNLAVYAVDDGVVSQAVVSAGDPWPLAVVTAPPPARFEPGEEGPVANPHAPGVPRECAAAPVRALAFDARGVVSVRFRIDGGAWQPMYDRTFTPAQWRGTFDARPLAPGLHEVAVEAQGTSVRTVVSRFAVIDAACDLGIEDIDRPLDPGEMGPMGEDGDTGPVDGDAAVDGDALTDGDTAVDGDTVVDGDEVEDGDLDQTDHADQADQTDQTDQVEQTDQPDAEPADGDAAAVCEPGEYLCRTADDRLYRCVQGGGWELLEDCAAAGMQCVDGQCVRGASVSGGCGGDAVSAWWPLIGLFVLLASGRRRRQA